MHEFQHADSPTWCIHCGTFDQHCWGECPASERVGKFDSRVAENRVRMVRELFGGLSDEYRAAERHAGQVKLF